jgi:hypothetical protein
MEGCCHLLPVTPVLKKGIINLNFIFQHLFRIRYILCIVADTCNVFLGHIFSVQFVTFNLNSNSRPLNCFSSDGVSAVPTNSELYPIQASFWQFVTSNEGTHNFVTIKFVDHCELIPEVHSPPFLQMRIILSSHAGRTTAFFFVYSIYNILYSTWSSING